MGNTELTNASDGAGRSESANAPAIIVQSGDPTVRDVHLGEWLGMRQPLNIRATIEANREELESYGPIHAVREMVEVGSGAERKVGVGVRPVLCTVGGYVALAFSAAAFS